MSVAAIKVKLLIKWAETFWQNGRKFLAATTPAISIGEILVFCDGATTVSITAVSITTLNVTVINTTISILLLNAESPSF